MLDKPTTQRIKNIFNSSFTLCILTKVYARYRPTIISRESKLYHDICDDNDKYHHRHRHYISLIIEIKCKNKVLQK
jgi:hypothetical protein